MTKSAAPRDQAADYDDDVVSAADIEKWTERERARRRAWLEGPTDEEKEEWAATERRRRLHRRAHDHDNDDEDFSEGRRVADRWQREVGLALAGIAGRIMDSPYSLLGNLIREGRQLEDDYLPRRRRRRVPSDD
ncbi:hypothetical protein C2U70_28760 [Bradyrhizobium guangdongense]|uniref:hypothetical protein n=1 Tax=Bradyrhizobium guangdongense TaxID=1325090 RepID=UPI0011287363|nr:hypothetical protein [Bradyrhizobium guangdongense]TPQ29165.1 hypothetical protein C2U70_28760 [Bradyrhizobium guangdongense]